jgi:hypothetical protein
VSNIFCDILRGEIMKSRLVLFFSALACFNQGFAAANFNAASQYTLKVMSCLNQGTVTNFIKKHRLENHAFYTTNTVSGKNWYILSYGHYHNRAEAERALKNLPGYFKSLHPVIRPISFAGNISEDQARSVSVQKKIVARPPRVAATFKSSAPVPVDNSNSQAVSNNRSFLKRDFSWGEEKMPRAVYHTPPENAAWSDEKLREIPKVKAKNILAVNKRPLTNEEQSFPANKFIWAGENKNVNQFSLPMNNFHLRPYVELNANVSDHVIASGQALFPFLGHREQTFLAIVDSKYAFSSNDGWSASGGFGYREVVNDRIWGGYLLADFNQMLTTPRHRYWVMNPGVESLGELWDFRINGYLPVGKRQWLDEVQLPPRWEDEVGIYDDIYFTGHTEQSKKVQITDRIETEINSGMGFDVEVGRTIPIGKELKVFLGGYHFGTKDFGNINGVFTRFTYKLNDHFSLEGADSYDNWQRNTATIGIKASLGGFSGEEKEQFGISGRLLDPIRHGMATINHGYLVPYKTKEYYTYYKQDVISIEHDNLWFYKTGSGLSGDPVGDGTFENPFVNFTLDNYNAINPSIGVIDRYPWLYVASGSYNFSEFSNYRFALPYGWGLYGRVPVSYKEPAVGANRPSFAGGLDLPGGENNLNSLRLYNDGSQNVCINLIPASGGTTSHLDYIEVGSLYRTAFNLSNAGNVYVNNSQFYAGYYYGYPYSPTSGTAYGIKLDNGSNLFLGLNNLINVSWYVVDPTIGSAHIVYGISASNSSNVNLGDNNNIIATVAIGYSAEITEKALGIDVSQGNLTLGNNNNIVANVQGPGNWGMWHSLARNTDYFESYGIRVSTGDLSIGNQNLINASTIGKAYNASDPSGSSNSYTGQPRAYGIYAVSGSTTLGNNNLVQGSAASVGDSNPYLQAVNINAYGYGIYLSSGNLVMHDYNQVTGLATAGVARARKTNNGSIAYSCAYGYGIQASGGGVTIGNNNIISATADGGDAGAVVLRTSFPGQLTATSQADAEASGLSLNNVVLNINDYNEINASAYDADSYSASEAPLGEGYEIRSRADASSNGIYLSGGSIALHNHNIIHSDANAGSADSTASVSGVSETIIAEAKGSSYGIQITNSNAVSVGNNNAFEIIGEGGTSSSQTYFNHADSSGAAYGISFNASALTGGTTIGNSNNFVITAKGGSAQGQSSINADSIAYANASGYAVYANNSSGISAGSYNTTTINSTGGTAKSVSNSTTSEVKAFTNAVAAGVYDINSSILLADDDVFNITVLAGSATIQNSSGVYVDRLVANAISSGYGIYGESSSNITIGNSDFFTISSTGGVAKNDGSAVATISANSNGWGIYSSASTVNIFGGGNNFDISAHLNIAQSGAVANARGINALSSSIIKFDTALSSSNKNNFTVRGIAGVGQTANNWGIDASGGASLQNSSGTPFGSFANILNCNNLTKDSGAPASPNGYRISWTPLGNDNWP